EAHRDRVCALMCQELGKTAPAAAEDETKDLLAGRQAQAAVTLLRLGRAESVWPLLGHHLEPRLRTFLIHRLAGPGAHPPVLIERFAVEPDASARRALLLALGGFDPGKVTGRKALTGRLLRAYRDDPDSGMHSCIDWLLRQRWGQANELERID